MNVTNHYQKGEHLNLKEPLRNGVRKRRKSISALIVDLKFMINLDFNSPLTVAAPFKTCKRISRRFNHKSYSSKTNLNKNCCFAAAGEISFWSWTISKMWAQSSVLLMSISAVFKIQPSLFNHVVIIAVLVSGQKCSCMVSYYKASCTNMVLSTGLDAAESRQKGEESRAFHSVFGFFGMKLGVLLAEQLRAVAI